MSQPLRKNNMGKCRGEIRDYCDICGTEYYISELEEQDGLLKCRFCIDDENPQDVA